MTYKDRKCSKCGVLEVFIAKEMRAIGVSRKLENGGGCIGRNRSSLMTLCCGYVKNGIYRSKVTKRIGSILEQFLAAQQIVNAQYFIFS